MTYNTLKELFTAICDAIRSKENSTDLINHQDIPARINALKSKLHSKIVTPTKSKQTITPDTGYDGLSQVTVNAIPDEYIDTSCTDGATAKDIRRGTSAYVNGQKINGSLSSVNKDTVYGSTSISEKDSDILFVYEPSNEFIVGGDNSLTLGAPVGWFGDATPAKVLQGSIFTSSKVKSSTNIKISL